MSFAIDHIAKQERSSYLEYYDDELTGLANQKLFLERVAQHRGIANSANHKIALHLIDIDGFKNINDSLGKEAGDALLQQMAKWLIDGTGSADVLARVNADQFAVVQPVVRHEGDVARLIKKSMDDLQKYTFHLDDTEFRISARVGVALLPDDATPADDLWKKAELALKKAKARGDRYLFFTPRK
ncbi:MAG: GGDEF domain-containing protein [Halioglobus sp.]|nr:GGDEF domain-containing protein [Halioglobus sp.]